MHWVIVQPSVVAAICAEDCRSSRERLLGVSATLDSKPPLVIGTGVPAMLASVTVWVTVGRGVPVGVVDGLVNDEEDDVMCVVEVEDELV